MLRIAINNPGLYLVIKKCPVIRAFFAPRLTALKDLRPEFFTQYISAVRGPEGVYMSTKEDRFHDVEHLTLNYICEKECSSILDVGVSSGITSYGLYQKLKAHKKQFKFFIAEKYSVLFVSGSLFCRVYDGERFIEGYFLGLVASGSVSWLFPVSRILFKIMQVFKAPKEMENISLYDPRVRRLLADGSIAEVHIDLFSGKPDRRYSYIRCMNLLNQDNFDKRQIRFAVNLLADSLEGDGVLQIGRTNVNTGVNRVTFFRKSGNKLEVERRVNGGADIMDCL